MKRILFFVTLSVLCSLCLVHTLAWAALSAHLDRYRITEGETVRLTVEATGQVSVMPDTRALNQDFEVTGTMSGSRVNIINGRMDSRTTWTISLVPLRSGELTIPSLTINGEHTPELTLHVADTASGADPDAATPVFLETEVDKTDPYVQGMVRYTQRVFFAVNLVQGSLSEPEHENALVQKLGEDREYVAERNGRSYNVIERVFVIFPQTSGQMVIPAAVLNAQIPQASNRHDPFFDRFFTNTRPIRLRGEAITLDVRSRSDQSRSTYWLPAELVELHETWQPDNNTIAVGDPITRNITIRALGVTGEQLPEPKLSDPDGFKLYPDRAQSKTQHQSHNVQGEKTLRLAYMPMQSGKYILPAFTLHWWDTVTDTAQVATLPERTIEILPGAGQQNNAAVPVPAVPGSNEAGMQQTPQLQQNAPGTSFLQTDRSANSTVETAAGHGGWFWATLVFAVLWLMTLAVLWRNKRQTPSFVGEKNTIIQDESVNSREARKRFHAACKENNPRQARQYLLKWAAVHWPDSPPRGLDELASHFDDASTRETLKKLDRVLYQQQGENWDGNELGNHIPKLPVYKAKNFANRTNRTNRTNRKGLPELYS